MGIPQDWAPYSSVEEAAKVYLRDPELALDQLRSVIATTHVGYPRCGCGCTPSWSRGHGTT